jgi:5'-3' exonuclease
MGIPSYFSYIVRNHSEIIRAFRSLKDNNVDHLYMDCNSIIYDVVRNFEGIRDTKSIIQQVIVKINEYITIVKPQKKVIVAFDGVAPVAKLEQQRNRRYKSWYQAQIAAILFPHKRGTDWNTTVITPGTVFMKELNETVQSYYKKGNNNMSTNLEIIVSSSFDYGEGEHKIFQYIRSHPEEHTGGMTIVYGLDADLIMLAINHLHVCPNIFLFRETPEFIKSIDASLEPNEQYLLDIPTLTKEILLYMTSENISINNTVKKNKIHDYIFLCFFLGNDFLPHFPAVNIRTGGVDKMLNAYKATIADDEWLTDGNTIVWKNVRKMVQHLANYEEEMLKKETKQRDRREKFHYPIETPEQKLIKFDATPTYERETEKYINPFQSGWQTRYYESLFDLDSQENAESKEAIVMNFCEGLEWTLKYYTTDCPDWKWKYKYNYPPLLEDLVRFMPYFEREMVTKKVENPVSPLVQLCYVMPRESLQFLPSALEITLKEEYSFWYPSNCEYVWAYCKYFWESHVELPEIDIDVLEKIVTVTTETSTLKPNNMD